ncbi:MAG: Crp/Fnr family transcriptional regulator [Magnetococcales bacterium]|nr:Crp/Fnr family transcriptional regulator [Magnetococcales bacterium]
MIIQAGDIIEKIYLIQTGCVSLFREDACGKRVHINTLQTGDMISDLCVFNQAPSLVSACALGDVKVLTIDKRRFIQLAYKDPTLILHLFDRIATHTRRLHKELISYIFSSHRLLHFSKRAGKHGRPPPLYDGGLLKSSPPSLGRLYRDGEMIIREGDVITYTYVVQIGQVGLFREDAYGNKIQIGTLHAGDIISDLCVFDQAPNLVSVCALGDVRVLTIDKMSLIQRVYEDPALILYLFERMATHTRHLHEELIGYIMASHRLFDLMGTLWEESTPTPLQQMTTHTVGKLQELGCFPGEIGDTWSADLNVACLLYDIGDINTPKEFIETDNNTLAEIHLSMRHVTIGSRILMQAAQQNNT